MWNCGERFSRQLHRDALATLREQYSDQKSDHRELFNQPSQLNVHFDLEIGRNMSSHFLIVQGQRSKIPLWNFNTVLREKHVTIASCRSSKSPLHFVIPLGNHIC